MPSGGARHRSGPPKQEGSARSDAAGFTLTALPSTYDGPVPEFPLPDASARELELWAEAWSWPQANFWALPSESWRPRSVAMWVRIAVRCEEPDAAGNLLSNLHRFAHEALLTVAAMSEVGVKVAPDQTAPKRAEKAAAQDRARWSRDRMKVVKGDGA